MQNESIKIYLCANIPKEQRIEQRLRDGLLPIQQHIGLLLWSRSDIRGGETLEVEMKKHLAQSDVFVVLVTPGCLASDICLSEIRLAQQKKGLRIISILVNSCTFEWSTLARFPSLPQNGEFMSSYGNTDEVWTDVIRNLVQMIEATHSEEQPA